MNIIYFTEKNLTKSAYHLLSKLNCNSIILY